MTSEPTTDYQIISKNGGKSDSQECVPENLVIAKYSFERRVTINIKSQEYVVMKTPFYSFNPQSFYSHFVLLKRYFIIS